jgi:hypothetical protein
VVDEDDVGGHADQADVHMTTRLPPGCKIYLKILVTPPPQDYGQQWYLWREDLDEHIDLALTCSDNIRIRCVRGGR